MNQDRYDFIWQVHKNQSDFVRRQNELKNFSPGYLTLRDRSLLYLSDLMLNLGKRIRPAGLSVPVRGLKANDGTLETKAKGC